MALKLDILANTRQFVSEMKKSGASVEDISDSLDDMARGGAIAGEKLEASFREITRASDKTGKAVKSDLHAGFKDAGKEAGQSGREAAASFSGGFEDVAGAAQETLANAFAGFGPIGAAAGVAIAAALGAALQGAADAQIKLDEARAAAAELAQTLYDNKGQLPMADAVSKLLELLPSERGAGNPFESFLNQWIDLGTNIDAVKAAARRADVPVRTFIDGLSGADMKSTTKALGAVDDAITKVKEKAKGELNWDNGAALSQLEALKTQLLGVQTSTTLAREALGLVGSSLDTAEAVAKIDAIGDAWQGAMTDASDYIAQTDEGITTFDWSKYLTDAEATLAAANEFKRKIVTLDPDIQAEGERIFEDQGAQAALAYTDSFLTASTNDKQRFLAAARNNGEAAGKAQGEALAREAEAAAKAKAQGNAAIPVKFRADLDDSAIRSYVPPVKRLRIVANGKVEWN